MSCAIEFLSRASLRFTVVPLLLFTLAFGCSGKNIMADENTTAGNGSGDSSEVPNIPELDEYIFGDDEYKSGIVPRKLVPERVAKYLIGKIKKDHDLKVFLRTESVADFYDTFEVAETFKTYLTKGEGDEAGIRKSAAISRIIARCGGSANVAFADDYYKHLVQKADTFRSFEDLVLLHEALGRGSNSKEIRERIKAKLASLETKAKTDYKARLEHKNFQWPIEQKLMRAEKVEAIKQQILAINDRGKRIEEEIKAYLAVGYGYVEYLYPWAARRLRQESWGGSPAEQGQRNDEVPLRKDVADNLRRFSENPTLSPDGKPGGDESLKLRVLRAIKFFDGEVTEKDARFLEENKNQQSDLLANEGFMLTNS